MTGQSLYYMGGQHLRHKILAVAEDEGVAQASYALKLLQSDGQLRIAAAGKHGGTGRQQTEAYEVEGPVMMFLTTTSETPDPELQNRCLTLQSTNRPIKRQPFTSGSGPPYAAGQQATHDGSDHRQHQNAQRLLEPLDVVIPWAEQLRSAMIKHACVATTPSTWR